MSSFSKFSIILITIMLGAGVYAAWKAYGGTTLHVFDGITGEAITGVNPGRGLFAHWSFNGPAINWPTINEDTESGLATSITATTSMLVTSLTNGILGQAISFNGRTDMLTASMSTTTYTFATWVRFATTTASQPILTTSGGERIETNGSGVVVVANIPGATIYVNGSAASAAISAPGVWHHVAVTAPQGIGTSSVSANYTLFTSQTPSTAQDADTGSVTLGVRWYSDTVGFVSGIRFYKGGTAGGNSHTVALYTAGGSLIDSKVSSGETSSGWQTVLFDSPLAVSASTEYVGAVLWPSGRYPATSNFFSSQHNNAPLHAYATTNGRYEYSGSLIFPDNSFNATNYFTDVIFTSSPNAAMWYGYATTTGGQRFFGGELDEMRHYSEILTPAEIARLYVIGSQPSVQNATIDTKPVFKNGLVGWWTFDGKHMTPNVVDASGNGNEARFSGFTATSTTPGVAGQAIVMPATAASSLDIGSSPAGFSSAQITAVAWVRHTAFGNWSEYVKHSGWTDSGSWVLYSGVSGGASFGVSNGTPQEAFGCANMVAKQWYFLVGTYDGTTARLYQDGVLCPNTGTVSVSLNTTGPFYLGNTINAITPFFMDDVRIYNRALSQEEIMQLYRQGAQAKVENVTGGPPNLTSGLVQHWTFDGPDVDYSSTTAEVRSRTSNAAPGNITPNLSSLNTLVPGKIGQGMSIDSDSGVTVQGSNADLNVASLTSGTIAAWVRIIAWPSDSDITYSLLSWNGCGRSQSIRYGRDFYGAGEGFMFNVARNSCGLSYIQGFVPLDSPEFGVWHHVAFVGGVGGNKLYVDGVRATNIVYFAGNENSTEWFDDSTSNGDVNGMIPDVSGQRYNVDDVRVYNRMLSDTEIQQLYRMGQ